MLPIKMVSGGQSYVETDQRTASEKKRQRARTQYSMMTEDQRDIVLRRNRANKKGRYTDATLSPASVMNMSSAVSMSPSSSTPAMQARPSEYVPAGLFLTRGS
jgi:hypothetical protein